MRTAKEQLETKEESSSSVDVKADWVILSAEDSGYLTAKTVLSKS